MDYQEKILLLVTVVLVVLALYLALSKPEMPVQPTTDEAKALLLKGMEFGYGKTNYVYSFSEDYDGYVTTYALTTDGNESAIEIKNPLSTKRVYFLNNDTVLCITYPVDEICSSVQNETDLENYLASLRFNFLSDDRIAANKNNINYLLDKNYLQLDAEITNKSVLGRSCREITYTIDYSNITISEAALFGIGSNSPKIFEWSICIDNATGHVYEKKFNYELQGMQHAYAYTMLSFASGSVGAIAAPDELAEGAVAALMNEKQQQLTLANCYTTMPPGSDQDRCISNIALNLHRKDICELSGGWRDRCLVALVPLTKEEGLCSLIASQGYRDDCYIELAGAYKDSSYCDNVQNASKMDFCTEVSTPLNVTTTEEEGYEVPFDMEDFMNYIDDVDTHPNATNSTGG